MAARVDPLDADLEVGESQAWRSHRPPSGSPSGTHKGGIAIPCRSAPLTNVGRCLSAAGAQPHQVTMLRIDVVGHRPEFLPGISEARMSVFGDYKPADTIVGVERLAEDGRLIEVEAIAVID